MTERGQKLGAEDVEKKIEQGAGPGEGVKTPADATQEAPPHRIRPPLRVEGALKEQPVGPGKRAEGSGEEGAKEEGSGEGKSVERIQNLMEEMEKIDEETKSILRDGYAVETIKGGEIRVPCVTGRAEMRGLQIVVGFMKENPDLVKKLFSGGGKISTEDIVLQIVNLVEGGYEKAQEIVALLLDKDRSWVEENLLAIDLVNVILPFSKAEGKTIAKIFSGIPQGRSFGKTKK